MLYVGITLVIAAAFLVAWLMQNRYTRMLNREKQDFAQRKMEKESDMLRLEKENDGLEDDMHRLEGELEILTSIVDDEGRHG